jgi:hypothetical protein
MDELARATELFVKFKKENTPKGIKGPKSRILPYLPIITQMVNENFSHKQIKEYLEIVGVKTSQTNLFNFIKKNNITKSQQIVEINTPVVKVVQALPLPKLAMPQTIIPTAIIKPIPVSAPTPTLDTLGTKQFVLNNESISLPDKQYQAYEVDGVKLVEIRGKMVPLHLELDTLFVVEKEIKYKGEIYLKIGETEYLKKGDETREIFDHSDKFGAFTLVGRVGFHYSGDFFNNIFKAKK